jgi:hypothetical protein
MAMLLNPALVSLSKRVHKALLRPDICHHEAEFSELQTATRHKLPRLYTMFRIAVMGETALRT